MHVTLEARALHRTAQLTARPHPPRAVAEAPTGALALAGVPLYVPASYRATHPIGVIVMLHGAGRSPAEARALIDRADTHDGFIVLWPRSTAESWDMMSGGFGDDVAQIDHALAALFDAYAIDPAHVAIAGFSDGASYALSLGLANGELFHAILAFAPGYHAAPKRRGEPRIFVAHGTNDRVLPISVTSGRLVPALRRDAYPLEYVEFVGGHAIPGAILDRALAWWRGAPRTRA
jgi:predicted esterase